MYVLYFVQIKTVKYNENILNNINKWLLFDPSQYGDQLAKMCNVKNWHLYTVMVK